MKPLFLSLLVLATAACSGSAPDDDNSEDDAPPAVEVGRVKLDYPSGYSSNCSCTFCIAYCTIDGRTTKGGTCC